MGMGGGSVVQWYSKPPYLQHDHAKQHTDGHRDVAPHQHHHAARHLQNHVEHHEHVREEFSAAPCQVDVVLLLAPLEPHAQPVLEERGDEAESSDMGEVVLRVAQQAVGCVFRLGESAVERSARLGCHCTHVPSLVLFVFCVDATLKVFVEEMSEHVHMHIVWFINL